MRAIDADAVPQEFWEYEFDGKWRGCTIKDLLDSQPTIQPEIVRCKDCGHYRHGLCMKASMCVNKSENGFCDWAEKREVTT